MDALRKNRVKSFLQILPILGLGIFISLTLYGVHLGIFNSLESLQTFIGQFGRYGIALFIGIQIIQAIVPILPRGISSITGILLFGNIRGLIFSALGSVIGEILIYFLVSYYGHAFVKLILSQKNYVKFEQLIEKSQRHMRRFLIIAFIFPFLPDNIACLAAGFVRMNFRDYVLIISALKPLSIAIYSYIVLNVLQLFVG